MPLHPGLPDLALRVLLTLVAGLLIGINRGERGHAAGLRTTTLVCLAASVSMIQMNLLLPVAGKGPDYFSVMDIMRLPLGILSGMGFIGAGAILRKGDIVSGVTTAATLWLVTVIGLCFGGGQLWLGVAATVLAWLVLDVMKRFDLAITRERKTLLVIHAAAEAAFERDLLSILAGAEIHASFVTGHYDRERGSSELTYDLRWKAPAGAGEPREVIRRLLDLPGVTRVCWNGMD